MGSVALHALIALAGVVLGAAGMAVVSRAQSNPAQSVAQQWIDALLAKDTMRMADLFADDAVWHDGATGDVFQGGPAAAHQGWDGVLGPVTILKEARLIGIGDSGAVVAWTVFGTPPKTAPIDMPGISVLNVLVAPPYRRKDDLSVSELSPSTRLGAAGCTLAPGR